MKLKPLVLAIALSGVSTASFSAGFQLFQQNASGLGNAYAGSAAVADNASIIFYNPAGMTQLKDREFTLGGTYVNSSIKYTDSGSPTDPGVNILSGNGGNGGTSAVVPNGYLSYKIDNDIYLGLGISAPFGSHSKYDAPWVGGAQALEFEIKTINVNPSFAYRVNQSTSLGFGLNIQKLDAKYIRKTTAALATAGGTSILDADDTSLGWNIGLFHKFDEKTNVGISYRSKIKHNLKGTFDTTGNAVPGLNAFGTGDAQADVTLPAMVFASISHKLNDKLQLLGDFSWTDWSSIPKLDIYRTSGSQTNPLTSSTVTFPYLQQTLNTNFQDSYRFALGANYQYVSNVVLKAGVAYDKTVVKEAASRLVSLPDNDRVWLSVGSQYKIGKDNTLDFGLARVLVKKADIDNNQLNAYRGRVIGSTKSDAWLFGLQYSQSF